VSPKVAVKPAPEEILTIAPPPAVRIEDATARMPRYEPVRLISSTWRHTAGSVSSITPKRAMPALLISTETAPKGVLRCRHHGRPVLLARDVETGEDRVIAQLLGERAPLLLEYVCDQFAPSATKPRA
jgi:hypothetical protein